MLRNLFLTLLLTWLAGPMHAKELFRAYDILYQGRLSAYHVEDLNGDRLKDLLLLTDTVDSTKPVTRLVSVILQSPTGFSRTPLQQFQMRDTVTLFDIGDVVGDSRKEFVYLEAGNVKYYTFSDTGFTLSALALPAAESLFLLPAAKPESFDFVRDINQDQIDEIIIPGISKSTILERGSGGRWQNYELPLQAEAILTGFYSERFSVGARTSAAYSTPYMLFEDFNGDTRLDLIAVYEDSMVVFCQSAQKRFLNACHHSVPLRFGMIWKGEKIQRSRIGEESVRHFLMRIKDLNNDGQLDVVAVRISTEQSFVNPDSEIRIHYGQLKAGDGHDRFAFSKEPGQIIRPGGTQLVLDIVDLNGDQRYDILIPVVKVGLQNIIRMMLTRSIEINAEAYLMQTDNSFLTEPNQKVRLTVKFSYRGGAASPVYEVDDFNADGYLDILSSLHNQLILFWGKAKEVFETNIGARYNVFLPQDGELVRAIDLNGDRKADVIIDDPDIARKEAQGRLQVLISN